jgi:hypothetical protein
MAAMEVIQATVFRSGRLTAAGDYAQTCPLAVRADTFAPAGRVGRCDALFCSPTLTEMASWHSANLGLARCGYVAEARELRYEGPEPYAYPVRAWNHASWSDRGDAGLLDFWSAGRPLREALADPAALLDRVPGDEREKRIEILIDPAYVRSARPVGVKRLIMAAETHVAEDIERTLFRSRWMKGNTWRDYRAENAARYGRASA